MLNIFGRIYFRVLVLMGKRPELELQIKESQTQTLVLDEEKDEWVWV